MPKASNHSAQGCESDELPWVNIIENLPTLKALQPPKTHFIRPRTNSPYTLLSLRALDQWEPLAPKRVLDLTPQNGKSMFNRAGDDFESIPAKQYGNSMQTVSNQYRDTAPRLVAYCFHTV